MRVLDADELIAQAMADTGLSDFGDDTLSERFGVLIGMFREAGMDAAGERIAAQVALVLLKQRLEVFEDRNRYPIADEVIEAPVFATGEPRSGTTLLHMLLSLDPNARSLRFW